MAVEAPEGERVSALSLLKQREERTGESAADDEAKDQYMAFDLGRLTCFNTTPVVKCSFGDNQKMQERAQKSVQLLVGRLFALPSEPAEHGRLAELPAPTTVLPREKPVPKPKPLTRWEQFAKEKGIQKKKKDRMVFDETTKEWRPQWGYKRANEDHTAIIEAGPNDDGSVDPFEKKANEKKDRIQKQKNQEKRNAEEAAGKAHLPVSDSKPNSKETKAQAKAALALAQKSTASVGKFDKKLKGEKKAPIKRKVEHMSGGGGSEKNRNLDLLSKIVSIDSATFDESKAANKGLASVHALSSFLALAPAPLPSSIPPPPSAAYDNRTVGSLMVR
jgi:regulator of ribosome biosynthesis